MKCLLRGFPGHPLHPPLTDATIGAYTFATAIAVLSRLGVSEHNTATAWWLALIVGLILTVPTALTGFVEWLEIAARHAALADRDAAPDRDADRDGPLRDRRGLRPRRLRGRRRQRRRARPDARRVRLLALGGWLGGAIVFVHGMRVLNLVERADGARRLARPDVRRRRGGGRLGRSEPVSKSASSSPSCVSIALRLGADRRGRGLAVLEEDHRRDRGMP